MPNEGIESLFPADVEVTAIKLTESVRLLFEWIESDGIKIFPASKVRGNWIKKVNNNLKSKDWKDIIIIRNNDVESKVLTKIAEKN